MVKTLSAEKELRATLKGTWRNRDSGAMFVFPDEYNEVAAEGNTVEIDTGNAGEHFKKESFKIEEGKRSLRVFIGEANYLFMGYDDAFRNSFQLASLRLPSLHLERLDKERE